MTTECKAEYPHCPKVAVGAVVFNEGRVLLVRRGKAPSKGLWAIPGGSVELGESLQEAAEREILEEAGIVVSAREPVCTFDVIERWSSVFQPEEDYLILRPVDAVDSECFCVAGVCEVLFNTLRKLVYLTILP